MRLTGAPPRLPVLVGSIVVAAAACLTAAGMAVAGLPLPSPLALLGCLLLLIAGVRFHLSIRLGAQRVELTWSEAGVMLALALAPSPWVVLLTPLAIGLSLVQRRFAPIKILYNVASCTTAAGGAAGVLALAGVSRPFSGHDLLVLAAAGVLAGLVTYLAVDAVVTVVQEVPLMSTWRASGGLQALTLAGTPAVAVGILALSPYGPLGVAAVPVVALCLHQGYEGRTRGRLERAAGQRHAAAVGRLTEDLDEAGVLRRAAEDACGLADVDAVDLVLPAHESAPAVLHRHCRRGAAWTGDPESASPLPARLVAEVPVPIGEGAPTGVLRAWLAGGAADLRLGRSQQEALVSLARHTGAAVRNARMHAVQTYHATHDRLTGLPARQLLVERVEAPLRSIGAAGVLAAGCAGAGTGGSAGVTVEPAVPAAVLVVELTAYQEIVATFGYDVAEDLLVRTARRLQAVVVDGEFLAHVDTDRFAVYVPAPDGPAQVRERAGRLLAAVTTPVQLETTRVTLDAAAGAGYSPTLVGSGTELLRQAAVALEHARATNVPFEFYDPAEDRLGGPAAVVMKADLRAALEGGQLDLHYQPIVHLPSGAPVGMEARLRWEHPTKGMLYAGEFLSVLEHSGDHARFISWQLDRALRIRVGWGERDLPVGVNVSARCLLDPTFPDQVAAALEQSGLDASQLILEVAETALLTQLGLVGDVLTRLRLQGVQVAIDGLGTGSSALFKLLQVPASHVKIDGYFVRLMLVDTTAAAAVGLAFDLGRRGELKVVATGVDSEEHVVALRQLGCDMAQGPYLVPPLHSDQVAAYLTSAPVRPVLPERVVVSLDSRRRTPVP